MTESEINLDGIEQKIISQSPPKNLKHHNRQILSNEKPKTSQKNESLRKTFYNFNNIYKVDDFKFLTQKNFNQNQTLDERKRNLLVQAFRNNVGTFLILRKYKDKSLPMPLKIKQAKKGKNNKNDSGLFENWNSKEENNLRSQEIEKIKIEVKVMLFEENSVKKTVKQSISPENLQSEFMNKFTSCLDLSKLEESEEILNSLTQIYEELLKDLSSKPLKVQFDANGQLHFVGFVEEKTNEIKENQNMMNLKIQKQEIIREIIEEQLKKISHEFQPPKSDPIISDPFNEKELMESVMYNIDNKMQESMMTKKEENEEPKPSYMEVVLGLKDDPINRSIYDENIIDKLLNAKDLFEVDLDFMKPKVIYPETPDLQFKNDEEKKIFGEIHKWLFEIETELDEENRAILEYKKHKMWQDPQEIFQNEFPEADDDDDEEEENESQIKKEKSRKSMTMSQEKK